MLPAVATPSGPLSAASPPPPAPHPLSFSHPAPALPTSNSATSSPTNLSTKSTPNVTPSQHSNPSSPKPTALELKARAKGKARATFSPTTGSPLHQQTPSRNVSPKISTVPSPTPVRPSTPPRPTTKDLHLEQYVTRDLLHAAAAKSGSQRLPRPVPSKATRF